MSNLNYFAYANIMTLKSLRNKPSRNGFDPFLKA